MQFGEKLHAQVGVRYSRVTTPMEFTDLVSPNPDDEQHSAAKSTTSCRR